MTHYLNPEKIALLALTLVYYENLIPTSNSTPVLSFLVARLYPNQHGNTGSGIHVNTSSSSMLDFDANLSKLASSMPGRTVYDHLLKKLWSIDCLDALGEFIDSFCTLLSKPREQILRERELGEPAEPAGYILRTSPLGILIRRSHLEFTRLQFQDSITLWQEFVVYRHPSRQAFERKNPRENQNALDVNFSDLSIDTTHPLSQIMYGRLLDLTGQEVSSSSYDIEHLFDFQVSELQRIGARLTDDMRSKIFTMTKQKSNIPKAAFYLKFLDSWRAGDYSTAYDNLHRYFDYTMQSRDRTFYQYALLNLAILQADFGCYEQAITAMQEAIATARENKDTTCLNFCLSWLYHFGRVSPKEMKAINENGILGSEMDGLAFLKSRAKDAEMWSLLSTTLLSEAKLLLQHGDSLAVVFENITKAAHLNIIKQVPHITGPTLLMKGSAFGRTGLTHLAWLNGETFLQCYSADAPIEDTLKCICRLAAIQSQQGRHKDADSLLDSVSQQTLRVLKHHNYWKFFDLLLKLKRCTYRNDLDGANYILQRLKSQGAPDQELEVSLATLEVMLLMRSSDLHGALELVNNLAERIDLDNNDVLLQCRLLTLKARILTASGLPLKTFTITMRAAQIAYRARLLPLLWEAICLLCNILNELSEFLRSEQLLFSIIPQVLEYQDCDLAAQAYSCLADTMMGLAGKEVTPKSNKRKEYVSNAMEYIDCALEQFRHMEDVKGQADMLVQKTMILKWRGDTVLANDVASQYIELKKKYLSA